MPDWDEVGGRFGKALTELDVEPIQAEAEKEFRLALVGAADSGKTTLACALAERPLGESGYREWADYLPEYRLPLSVEDITALESATLIILLLDATKGNYLAEVAAADYLSYLGKPMLVCYSKMDLLPSETRLIRGQARWRGTEIMPLQAVHPETVKELLGPAILDALPAHALSLARHLPLFRSLAADKWIEQMALVNATYAAASGLAEDIPMLRMPLHADDIEVVSTNLAAMAYRLALAYGLPMDWHQDATASNLALGTGALWQQFARQLLGLLPLWGLESKVGLAYGGTLVSGRAIQAWCDTGHVLSPNALREVCRESAAQARKTSRSLVAKAREALPATPVKRPRPKPKGIRLTLPQARLLGRRRKPICAACGRDNPMDAAFCAYCGAKLEQAGARVEGAKEEMQDTGSGVQDAGNEARVTSDE